MRALRLHGPQQVRLDEVPAPELRPGCVKIAVDCAGICGSDIHLFLNAPVPFDYVHPVTGESGPHILGHEFSGRVTEVAADVMGIDIGQLVAVEPILFDGTCGACQRGDTNLCESNGFIGIHGWGGGMSQYVVVPADRVHVMPPGISAETAALIEPLAVAWRSVSRSGMKHGDTVLIVGGGPVGLCLLLVARARGADAVLVSEPNVLRRTAAHDFGAHAVLDPNHEDIAIRARELTGGQGVDVAFDASGAASAAKTMLRALRKGGTAVAVAASHPHDFDPNTLMIREIAYVGSYAYAGDDFPRVIEAVRTGAIETDGLVSTRIALEDAVELGFQALLNSPNDHLKILIRP